MLSNNQKKKTKTKQFSFGSSKAAFPLDRHSRVAVLVMATEVWKKARSGFQGAQQSRSAPCQGMQGASPRYPACSPEAMGPSGEGRKGLKRGKVIKSLSSSSVFPMQLFLYPHRAFGRLTSLREGCLEDLYFCTGSGWASKA